MPLERLHKLMAAAGAGSRRQCEDFIAEGRVSVNGQVIKELGHKVDPEAVEVRLDGERLKLAGRVYYVVHKPQGVITTCKDEFGRALIIDMVPGVDKRFFPVGRLDAQSTGLVLLTNDGDVAQKLTHPRYEVQKCYEVRVKGPVGPEDISRMKKGIWLSDGRARVEGCDVIKRRPTVTDLRVTLHEGKNREIRRVLAKLRHPVITLKRVSMGPLELGDLQEGESRRLTHPEIEMLKRFAAELKAHSKRPFKREQRFGEAGKTFSPQRSQRTQRTQRQRGRNSNRG